MRAEARPPTVQQGHEQPPTRHVRCLRSSAHRRRARRGGEPSLRARPRRPFALPDAAGRIVELGKLRGGRLCRLLGFVVRPVQARSFPWMSEMAAHKYGPKGLTIVAINVDKKREDAQRFLTLAPASSPSSTTRPGPRPWPST